jgi:tRNA A-37 threonylcarbamoyl transferase component Bud32
MAMYLERARNILEKRPENASRPPDVASFLLNEKQCTHLWRIIRLVYNYLSSSQLPNNKRHKYLPNVFKEFCMLVTRADDIVQVFSSDHSWLQAAIFQGHHRLAFKELILDLQACVRLFHESTGHHIPDHASAAIWRRDYLDAAMDAADLRSKLGDLLARPALGEDKRLLAQYLLQRENGTLGCNWLDDYIPEFYRVKSDSSPASGKQIGCGSYGAVSEVKWLGMTCAKKHFRDPTDENSVKEFMKEVNVLAKLNHPHIVKLLCVSEQPELFFVMEMMPMSLSVFIKERWWGNPEGIAPAAAVDSMLQMARGIEYLHQQGIVHRDLKSSNILVTPSQDKHLRREGYAYVKLIDFGLAKTKSHDLTHPTREMMGTSRWRAPEAFGKDQPIDWKKADAYSFAMMCSEVLTGVTPFISSPFCELYTRITSGERPELPSSCPGALAALLEICWDSNPSVRPCFTQIKEALVSVKDDLLKFRWDSYDSARVAQMSESGFRSLSKTVMKRSLTPESPRTSPIIKFNVPGILA